MTSDKTVLNPNKLAARFRDNYGYGIQNLIVALSYNINTIDSGAGRMGLFPYSGIGSKGYISTLDVLYLIELLGLKHTVDHKKMSYAESLTFGYTNIL